MTEPRVRAALLGTVLFVSGAVLRGQCTLPGATHVSWPGVNPVWDFCFRSPASSSGGNGSGLEFSEVKYNGTLVIARAHIPVLNVKYSDTGLTGCGGANRCYRDWFYSQQPFQCAPTAAPGICTGESTPQSVDPNTACAGGEACTVCDHPGMDAGSFDGVAVESLPDRLKLTAQCQAGWYRYIPVWEFFADGTIQPHFVATSIDHTCVSFTHHHHAYFRLDVDVATSGANFVDQVLSGGSTQRVTTERSFTDTSPDRGKWRIGSPGSPYVVEITRNPGDGAAGDPLPIPGDFPVADAWVLAYNSSEISDYSNTTSGCAININPWDNTQNVDGADVVMWVRAAALHIGEPGGEAQDCSSVGPTIRVLPTAPPGTSLHTLAPCRIVDTRLAPGPNGGPALGAGAMRNFVIAGQCGVPATAKSVAVNLTATQPGSAGHLTAFPAGGAAPNASSLNFSAGQTRANNAVLSLGAGGAVSVNSVLPNGSVHFILDVTGYFE
jgi:hypothetical protein